MYQDKEGGRETRRSCDVVEGSIGEKLLKKKNIIFGGNSY